jgi:hypothetical protein
MQKAEGRRQKAEVFKVKSQKSKVFSLARRRSFSDSALATRYLLLPPLPNP